MVNKRHLFQLSLFTNVVRERFRNLYVQLFQLTYVWAPARRPLVGVSTLMSGVSIYVGILLQSQSKSPSHWLYMRFVKMGFNTPGLALY